MGNAAITIHHPTSLKVEPPYLESGKLVNMTGSLIRVEKKDGAAVGCGGVFSFKKIVEQSDYTYKITKTNSQNLAIGLETTITADEPEKGRVNRKLLQGVIYDISRSRQKIFCVKYRCLLTLNSCCKACSWMGNVNFWNTWGCSIDPTQYQW